MHGDKLPNWDGLFSHIFTQHQKHILILSKIWRLDYQHCKRSQTFFKVWVLKGMISQISKMFVEWVSQSITKGCSRDASASKSVCENNLLKISCHIFQVCKVGQFSALLGNYVFFTWGSKFKTPQYLIHPPTYTK